MKRITASCIIEDHVVVKNGKIVFDDRRGDGGGTADGAHPGDGEARKADLPDFLQSVYQYTGVNYPRFYKMDNLSKLGWLAAEILLKESFHAGKYPVEEIGVVLANANASLDTDLKYFDTVKEFPSPSLFVYTLPNIMIGEICIRGGFKGENAFFISDRFDADFTVQYVRHLLDKDILQVCICGWVDLLGSAYKAALFLVEKGNGPGADAVGAGAPGVDAGRPLAFTAEALNKMFSGENGQIENKQLNK
jgi:hypothetical protein